VLAMLTLALLLPGVVLRLRTLGRLHAWAFGCTLGKLRGLGRLRALGRFRALGRLGTF
jgi:hypothetical protein